MYTLCQARAARFPLFGPPRLPIREQCCQSVGILQTAEGGVRVGDDQLSDDLMGKFEAIERMLTARREALRLQDEPEQQSSEAGPSASVAASAVGTARPVESARSTITDATLDEAAATRRPRGTRRLQRPRQLLQTQRRRVIVSVLILILMAAGGGAAAMALTRHDTATRHDAAQGNAAGSPSATATRLAPIQAETEATAWVMANIGPTHVVACDVSVCALLSRAGLPRTSMVTAGSDIGDIEGADVAVTTAVSRNLLGAALTGITSPEPLAAFGTGDDRVEVTAVALTGTADYARQLAQDRGDRKQVGATLAGNARIVLADPADSAPLADGLVDSRLCSLLALISGSHTITVASFGAPGPGAGPDIPAATTVISAVDGRPATGNSPQARALLALLAAQRAPYHPTAAVAESTGLHISFAQPEPLGLITGAQP